ncbi:MAG: hypothetical protein ACTSR0_04225 [Candidatus Asgardarchaeia archaeon]
MGTVLTVDDCRDLAKTDRLHHYQYGLIAFTAGLGIMAYDILKALKKRKS